MLKVRKGERVKCWIFFFTNKLLATIYMQGYNNKDYCLLWLPMIFFSSFLFSFYNFVTGKSFLVYGWHERSCRELLFDIKLQHISKDMLLNFMTMMMRMRMRMLLAADGFSLLCVSYKLFNFPGRHHIYILQHIRMWNETEWSERVSVLFCCRFVSAGVTEIIAIISHEVYIGVVLVRTYYCYYYHYHYNIMVDFRLVYMFPTTFMTKRYMYVYCSWLLSFALVRVHLVTHDHHHPKKGLQFLVLSVFFLLYFCILVWRTSPWRSFGIVIPSDDK